jgi:hypothetical protein
MTKEEIASIRGIEQEDIALYDIAIVKSYNYCEEYDSNSGQTQIKDGHRYLKQGYIDGFLAGFAHRLGGGHASD